MNNIIVDILTRDQIYGNDTNRLDIFKQRGASARITGFAILLGGNASKALKDRTGQYWTKTDDEGNNARVVNCAGNSYNYNASLRDIGCRPVLLYSSIASICSNQMLAHDNILEVEYGEYPQTVVGKNMQRVLERKYYQGTLKKTGKTYTTDSRKDDKGDFEPQLHIEYEYQGKKYVRVKANFYDEIEFTLSNKKKYQNGDYVWVEVEPIKWLGDLKKDRIISEDILFAGVQFNLEENYKGDFTQTNLYWFLNTHFIRDIQNENIRTAMLKQKEELNKKNLYNLNFDQVTEEEIIIGAIKSGIAPFLHGLPSDGKSARIKELDPDCEIIYMITQNPDSFAGKSVYNQETGEMIDVKPTWLKRLEEKCQKEKDKIHILFLDEITNVKSNYILNLAYNLILDRELDGKWKLPENARIVVAGNEVEDSISAIEIPQPLYNRLAHIYIHTTVEDWLNWASTPIEEYGKIDYEEGKVEKKIHPAIYAFINYRREAALRTTYTGKKPNADPRKWEMASKMLYTTGKPEMLRALIGEALTREFIAFCNQRVITLEDVLNGNYTEEDLNMNLSEKAVTAVALSQVDEEHIETVREFVEKLGEETLSLFDNLWTQGDNHRLEKLERETKNEKSR